MSLYNDKRILFIIGLDLSSIIISAAFSSSSTLRGIMSQELPFNSKELGLNDTG